MPRSASSLLKNRTFAPQLENLEGRRMMSADPTVFDADSVGWASVRNMTSSGFTQHFNQMNDNNILVDIEVNEINGQQRVGGVWQANTDNRGWYAYRNLTSQQFSDRWTQLRDQGYRLVDQESYSLGGNQYYAGIWIENQEGHRWASWRNLTSEEFSQRFQQYREDFIIIDVEAYQLGNDTRYSMIWVENEDNTSWAEYRNMTSEQFSTRFDQLKGTHRMADVESYQINGQQYYAGIWVENSNNRRWIEKRDMTATGYRNNWYRYRDLGYRLTDFEAYETDNGTRYAGIWRQNTDRPDWELRSSVDTLASTEFNTHDVPGMSVAIAHNGDIKYMRGFGHQDVDAGVWYSAHTRNRLASISKALAGVLTMDMVEDGILELDDATRAHERRLPRFHTHTVEQLLSNRGGVTHYNSDAFSSPNEQFDNAYDASQFFVNQPLLFQPGEGYNYSTHGYTLLGTALEGASGQSVSELFHDRITVGMGLPSLRPEDRSVADSNRSQLYSTSNQEVSADNLSWKILGGGTESSAYDLVRFGTKLLNEDIITQASMDTMWSVPGGASSGYALGWNVGVEDGTQVVAKNGGQRGANTYIRMYPEENIVIVVLSNRQSGGHSATQLGRDIGALMLESLPEPPPEPVVGDFNGDSVVNAADIDLMFAAIRSDRYSRLYDLDRDRRVDDDDADVLVHDILRTHYGDANLDRSVDSSDLVQIFRQGEYEDRIRGNSTWSEGDFNGDREFNSSDLVKLFADGGYRPVRRPV